MMDIGKFDPAGLNEEARGPRKAIEDDAAFSGGTLHKAV
jgi:hypothetical protein